jgi:hypothetical protein
MKMTVFWYVESYSSIETDVFFKGLHSLHLQHRPDGCIISNLYENLKSQILPLYSEHWNLKVGCPVEMYVRISVRPN